MGNRKLSDFELYPRGGVNELFAVYFLLVSFNFL